MGSFKQYLSEKEFNFMQVGDKFHVMLENIMTEAKKLGNNKVILRGHGNKGSMGGVLLVTNDRDGFYGMMNPNAVSLIKEIGIRHITFGARQRIKAKMFGYVYIIVPKGDFKAFQSKEHSDVLAAFKTFEPADPIEIQKIAKTYTETLDDINDMEILFDTKEYYLIDIDWILKEIDKGNKFQKYKAGTVNTYADLADALKSVISFQKFKERK